MIARLAALALCAAASSPAGAGVSITLESGGKRSLLRIEGNKVRVEDAGTDAGMITIFDGDARKIVSAVPAERLYMELTEADARAMGARLRSQMDAPAGTPPAGSAGKAGERDVRYEPTGKSDEVAGFRCEGYREIVDGQLRGEGCFIPWSAGALTREDLAPLVQMGKFMEAMAAGMGMPAGQGSGSVEREVTRAPGFPAVYVEISPAGGRGPEERLVELRRGPQPADAFRPPAGFRKAPSAF